MVRKSSKVRQEPETEQGRGEDVEEERGVPRRKCIAKRRIWRRIVWRKRETNNLESRGPIHRSRKLERKFI